MGDILCVRYYCYTNNLTLALERTRGVGKFSCPSIGK